MSFFSVPNSSYTSVIDLSKLKMTWHVYLVLCILFTFLTVLQFISNSPDAPITLLAVILAYSMVFYMKRYGDYKLVAILSGIVGFAINQMNIFTVINGERFIDLLWILVVSFYVFYALGVLWGVLSLLFNFLGLLVYLFITPTEAHIASIMNRNSSTDVDIFVNAIFTISVITYLLIKITQATRYAEQEMQLANQALREQNEIVLTQNEEKTVLLQEIHHRVKNNLQVISSMLRLQASDTSNPETQRQLHDAVNRVSSMALIHEKMYQTQDLVNIKLSNYLESLIMEVISSHCIQLKIRLHITSDIDYISIDQLVPLALIVNELATNTMKHGMQGRQEGTINLNVVRTNNHLVEMIYTDNGDPHASDKPVSGFGTMLIEAFVEQLDGSYTRSFEEGTLYHFKFPHLKA